MINSSPADVLSGPCSAALGRPLLAPELEHLIKYLELLLKWQKTQRLVASADPAWIASALMADSLLFLRVLPVGAGTIIDVGSGAGFPGIPIKIVSPRIDVTLLESRQRRASFLKAVVRELGLRGVSVVDRRLESLVPDLAGVFDAAVMRCAGAPDRLLPAVLPLLRPGGVVAVSGPPAGTRRGDKAPAAEPWRIVTTAGLDRRSRVFWVARKS